MAKIEKNDVEKPVTIVVPVDFSNRISGGNIAPQAGENTVYICTKNGKYILSTKTQKTAFDFLRQVAKNPNVEIGWTAAGFRAAGLANFAVKMDTLLA